jgi:ferritin-like metal-binding protein YciE
VIGQSIATSAAPARTWARLLGDEGQAALFGQTLVEEKETDLLTDIATSQINIDAEEADEEED